MLRYRGGGARASVVNGGGEYGGGVCLNMASFGHIRWVIKGAKLPIF